MTPICPYCEQPAELVTGRQVYPARDDLALKKFWMCRADQAWVGCHTRDGIGRRTDTIPLGRLANAELRLAKQRAHAALDPLFQSRQMTRRETYRWLSEALGVPKARCHIAWFDVADCERVVQAVRCRTQPSDAQKGTR